MVHTRLVFLATASSVFAAGSSVAAAPACDHELPLEVTDASGAELGWQPGDTVCVAAGPRPFLRFRDVIGSESEPILIVNSGGVVAIDNDDRGYGLTFDGSRFFRLSGTGSDEHPYGFSIRAARTGPDYSASCVTVAGLSTDYELDHLEIFDCGFAGMNLKTEPRCDGSANLGTFVQKNSRIHHNFIHDTHGEGIYFGSTGYGGREYDCDGERKLLHPHTHEGVWIHDNLIRDTGWDGLQVGVSPKDCFVYRNTILNVGLAGEEYQMQGIQIGGASACTVSENVLIGGPAIGIIALDVADTRIVNNTLVDFQDGVYLNDRDTEATQGARYVVAHNTLVSIRGRGISLFGTRSVGNGVVNNLVVATGESPLAIGGNVDVTQEGNLILESVAEARFVGSEEHDYRLAVDSPAVDAGSVLSEFAVERDQRGASRDAAPDVGAFEYGVEAPAEGSPPPVPADPTPGPASASADDDAGCGCRHVGASSRSLPFLWSFSVVLLAALRCRRPCALDPRESLRGQVL